jgi:lipopolysaccharide transport system ATP-binding protein
MSELAIKCDRLSKRYRLGERESYRTLRDTVANGAAAPFRRVRSALSGNGNGIQAGKVEARNSFLALDDVSFELKRGEALGIIGRNGAGKSTLLKILSRITKPTSGAAEIHGRVGSLLEVGTGFHPELTGRENIFLNGAILGMRRLEIEERFDEIVSFAEIERFVDTPVKRYSSGMYVRLAFAVAAHLEPEILIVDEVLAVGDAAFQKKCLGKMGQVAQHGRTVLFVSHHMGAIRNLCSEVIWLDEGKVMVRGMPPAVVDEYLRASLHRSGSSIDLASMKRYSALGEQLRIKSIEFNKGGPILHGEPLSVEIEFETRSGIHDAAFGFGFSSMDGVRVMTVDSDLSAPQRNLAPNVQGSVSAVVPKLELQPGRYSLDVGARSGNNSAVDYIKGCAQVDVLPGPETPPLIIREDGGMRIPAAWQWGMANNQ